MSHNPQAVLDGEHVTASFGVTEVMPNDAVESLLGRVDRALYEAKRLGRDRVVSLSVTGVPLDLELAVPISRMCER